MAKPNPTKSAQSKARKHEHALLIYAMREFDLMGERKEFVFQTVAEALGIPVTTKRDGYAALQAFWDADPKHGPHTPAEFNQLAVEARRAAQGPYTPWPAKPRRKQQAGKAAAPVKAKATDVNSDEFLRSFEWRQLRMVVLKKRGARCECCGASPKDGIVIHVDHIKPRRKHPELALAESNLQVLCEVCNHGKGAWDQTDWRDDSHTSGESSADSPVTRSGDGDGKMTPVVSWPRLIRAR